MTIQEAIKTGKAFYLATAPFYKYYQYFKSGSGPYKILVDCDYFVVNEDGGDPYMTTSIDLYPEEVLSEEWAVLEASIQVDNG